MAKYKLYTLEELLILCEEGGKENMLFWRSKGVVTEEQKEIWSHCRHVHYPAS